jgi:lysozyme family protein
MADFVKAFQYMMSDEDAAHLCKTVPDIGPKDKPGPFWAISGINSDAWPVDFARINALPLDKRLPEVMAFYKAHFWNSYMDQLTNQDIANRLLDGTVNTGMKPTLRALQLAVNDCKAGTLIADGKWGPRTLAAVNAAPANLLNCFRGERLAFYKLIVVKNPAKAKFLGTADAPGPWWRRALK